MDDAQAVAMRYDERTGTVHLHHEWDGMLEVTETIQEVVEHITGTPPPDHDPWTDIDRDAIDRLFKPQPGDRHRIDGLLSFEYDHITVTLYSNGNIELEPDHPYIVDTDHIERIH